MKKYLRNSNYSIGGTDVIASTHTASHINVQDFNECENPKFHDCSENSQCFNLRGTYTCSCKEGYSGTKMLICQTTVFYFKILFQIFPKTCSIREGFAAQSKWVVKNATTTACAIREARRKFYANVSTGMPENSAK